MEMLESKTDTYLRLNSLKKSRKWLHASLKRRIKRLKNKIEQANGGEKIRLQNELYKVVVRLQSSIRKVEDEIDILTNQGTLNELVEDEWFKYIKTLRRDELSVKDEVKLRRRMKTRLKHISKMRMALWSKTDGLDSGRASRLILSDNYLKHLLAQQGIVVEKRGDLLNIKRQQIMLWRELKRAKEANYGTNRAGN